MTYAEAVRDTMFTEAKVSGGNPYSRHVWKGDPNLLQEAYGLVSGFDNDTHPLNEQDAVMRSVARSPLFVKVGRILAQSRTAHREAWFSVYKLAEGVEQDETNDTRKESDR